MIDKKLERVLRALANGRRLAIIAFLKSKHRASVGEIASHLRLSIKATSRHLVILFGAGLVTKEQKSLFVYYRLPETFPEYIRSLIVTL